MITATVSLLAPVWDAGVDSGRFGSVTSLSSGSGPNLCHYGKHIIRAVCLSRVVWRQICGFPVDKVKWVSRARILSWGHSSAAQMCRGISQGGYPGKRMVVNIQVKFISNAVSHQVVSYKSDPF